MNKVTILAILAISIPAAIACMDNQKATNSSFPEGFVPVKTVIIDGHIIHLDAKNAHDLAHVAAGLAETKRRRAQKPVGATLQLKAPVAPPSRLTEMVDTPDSDGK